MDQRAVHLDVSRPPNLDGLRTSGATPLRTFMPVPPTPLPHLTSPHSPSARRSNTISLPQQPFTGPTGTSSPTPNLLFSPAPSAPSTKVHYPTILLSGTTPAPSGVPHPLDRHLGPPRVQSLALITTRYRQERLQGTSPLGPAVAWGKSSYSRCGSRRPSSGVPPLWSLPLLTDTYSL